MTQKQRTKHIAEKAKRTADKPPFVAIPVGTTLTPNGLGTWQGGLPKSATNWASLKSRAIRTGDAKGMPKVKKEKSEEKPVGTLNIALEKVE